MAWYLNRALTNMRDEVNDRWPDRDKASDGTIGNAEHASRSSSHNPDPDGSVDAWDMDKELNGVGKPYANDVKFVIEQFETHEASLYWIYDDEICFRSTNWKPQSYPAYLRSVGADPANRNRHDKHVHFNSRESHENSKEPWGIKEAPMDASDMEFMLNYDPNVTGKGIKNPYPSVVDNPTISMETALHDTTHNSWQSSKKLDTVVMAVETLRSEVVLLRGVIEDLATVIRTGGGNVDTTAILSGIDERLAIVRSDFRDAVADLGEGGASQVRGQ